MFIILNYLLEDMVIGKSWLYRLLLAAIILTSLIPAVAAEETDCLVYFYGTSCTECSKASQHLAYIKTKYPQLQIKPYEVYYSPKNARLLEQYFMAHHVPENSQGLPVLFLPGSYFVGSSTMIELLEGRILDNQNAACPTVEEEKVIGVVGPKEPYRVLDTLTVSMVTKAAFKDMFRPGMIAFLLFFLMLLSSYQKKENVLQRGILSIITLFLALLLFGLGLLFQAPSWIPKLIGGLAILASVIRIKGFFATWKIVFDDISETLEQKIINYLRYLFTPLGVVIISFIMAVFSSSEISELLALFRTLTLEGIYSFRLLNYLIYHSLILIIIPTILVLILYRVAERLDLHARSKEPYNDPKAEKWRGHTQKVLRFVVSSLMLIFGFVLLFM